MNITIKQYQEAIKNALSARQIEILQILYSFPNSTATAKELAEVIHPTKPATIIASGQIGKIGKAISDHLNVLPDTYFDGKNERPAYFLIVGPYYSSEGKKRGQRPGWEMTENLRIALENLNLVSSDKKNQDTVDRLPTEIFQFEEQEFLTEGKATKVTVNRYERNLKARLECIKHYGDKCFICDFDFGQQYGDMAKGFIHVHHLKSLAEINGEYVVNPVTDLIPVCANCHSVIHLTRPAMTVDEMKRLIKAAANSDLPKAGRKTDMNSNTFNKH